MPGSTFECQALTFSQSSNAVSLQVLIFSACFCQHPCYRTVFTKLIQLDFSMAVYEEISYRRFVILREGTTDLDVNHKTIICQDVILSMVIVNPSRPQFIAYSYWLSCLSWELQCDQLTKDSSILVQPDQVDRNFDMIINCEVKNISFVSFPILSPLPGVIPPFFLSSFYRKSLL